MKKLTHCLAMLLGTSILLLLVIIFPVNNVDAADGDFDIHDVTKTSGDYTYSLVTAYGKQYICLETYHGNEENVIIPETIDGVKVIKMMDNFKNPDKIKTITLSSNIETIGSGFGKLKNLETIKVDAKNPTYYAKDGMLFWHYKKRVDLVFYPANKKGSIYRVPTEIRSINGAFTNNRNLKTLIINSDSSTSERIASGSNIETIIIPDKVKYISEQSFADCRKLKKVILGKDIIRIYMQAFENCTSLETIILPKKLERIDWWTFKNCKSLKKLTIPSSVHYMESRVFEGCPATIKKESYLKKQKNGTYIAEAPVKVNGRKKIYKAKNITKIRPEYKTITIKKGSKKKLNTTVYISSKKKGILDYSLLRFTSSNKKVARVTSHGNIYALKKGKTTITVSLRNKNLSYKITVKIK